MSDKYTEGAKQDAAMIVANAQGWDVSIFAPELWHAPNVPTFYGAKVMAEAAGITVAKSESNTLPLPGLAMNGSLKPPRQWLSLVWVTGGSIAGAGRSCDPVWGKEISLGLAFRATVEKLLFGSA